jgi:hypothetical protein
LVTLKASTAVGGSRDTSHANNVRALSAVLVAATSGTLVKAGTSTAVRTSPTAAQETTGTSRDASKSRDARNVGYTIHTYTYGRRGINSNDSITCVFDFYSKNIIYN